jgi:hypothetical protein
VIDGVPTRILAWGIARMSLLAGWGALAAYGAVILTDPWGIWFQVPVAAIATVAVYAVAAVLPVVRRDLGELRTMLRLLRRERGRREDA